MTAPDSQRLGVIVDVLALEYQALRSEILTRSAHRYQSLTVAITAAALMIGFAPQDKLVPTWVVIALALSLLLIGLLTWWRSGQFTTALSVRLSQIEGRLNQEVTAAFSDPPVDALLRWETLQNSERGGRWLLFLKGPANPARAGYASLILPSASHGGLR